jgi:hypothetical protein
MWNFDTDASNRFGQINVMHLDMTGGNQPFVITDDQILMRLVFRLKDTVSSGEVHHLIFDDVTFATVNPDEAISTSSGNIRTNAGSIIIK